MMILLISTLLHIANVENARALGEGNNGGRPGYHMPSQTTTYLPNPMNPLQRELWRVFKKEDGTAYIIPRPDGLGLEYGMCQVTNSLFTKAEQYGLCDRTADPDIINSIDPDVALEFTAVFHQNLMFVANGNEISPWVPDEDILLACDTLVGDSKVATESYCTNVRGRCDEKTGVCLEITFIPSEEEVEILVPALNKIYGIPELGEECSLDAWRSTDYMCPVASCYIPEGCTYTSHHIISQYNPENSEDRTVRPLRTCCQELCYSIDKNGERCDYSGSSQFEWSFLIQMTPFFSMLFFLVPY